MPLVDYENSVVRRQLYKISMGGTWNPATGKEAKLGMCRAIYMNGSNAAYASFYIAMGLLTSHNFAIIGSGWGYSLEYLNDIHGYNGVGIDTSAYIHSIKDQDDSSEIEAWLTEAGWISTDQKWIDAVDYYSSGGSRLINGTDTRRCRVTILNEDGVAQASRDNILGHFGLSGTQKLDWAISEAVIESLSDADTQALSINMHLYADNVAHTVFARPNQVQINTDHPGNICNTMNFKSLVSDWRTVLPNDYLIVDPTGEVSIP